MTEQDKQKLKRKLAEWAGFYFYDYMGASDIDSEIYQMNIYTPEGKPIKVLPDFPNSLDACFHWLVPKLTNEAYIVELLAYEEGGFKSAIHKLALEAISEPDTWYKPITEVKDKEPALALCLAIEKLIEGEK